MNKIITFTHYRLPVFITFLWLISLYANPVFSQTGCIKGHVTALDGTPLENIKVIADGLNTNVLTNGKGYYEMDHLPVKNYVVKVLSGDSVLQSRSVAVNAGDTVQVDFTVHHLVQQSLSEVIVRQTKNAYVTTLPSSSLRLDEPLSEIPQSIHIIHSKTIKDIGANTTDDILRAASGVLPVNNAGQDIYTMIRGVMTQNSILRNGIGAGYFYDMNPDPDMIDRVEVIKGPAGFMISNASSGGMINIVTKQPSHQKIRSAEIGYGSWNMLRAVADIGGEVGKKHKLTYRLNTGIQHQNKPYRYGYFTKYFIAGALKYEAGKNTDITLEYNFVHGKSLDDARYLPTVNGQLYVVPDNLLISDPNAAGMASYDHYVKLSFQHSFNEHWNLQAHAGLVRGRWNANSLNIDTDHEGGAVINDTIYRYVFKDDYHNRLYNAIAFLNGKYNMGKHLSHHIVMGLDFGKTSISENYILPVTRSTNLYYPNPIYHLPKDDLQNFQANVYPYKAGNNYQAIYLQDQLKVYEKLMLTIGARYTICNTLLSPDAISKQTDKKLTPRFGINYLFNSNFLAYVIADGTFTPQIGKSITGSEFEPLTGNNKEIGLKSFWFNKKMSIDMAFYRTVRNDALTADPDNPSFQKAMGQSIAKGIELDIIGQVNKNIVIMANYSYIDSRITKSTVASEIGLYTFNAPVHQIANVFIKYNFTYRILNGLSLSAGLQYKDKFSSSYSANAFLPGYTLLEAAAGYTYKKWYINLNVYNLTNAKYVNFGSKYNATDWIYSQGAPVNFRLGIGFNL